MLAAALLIFLGPPLPESAVWNRWYGGYETSELESCTGTVVDASSGSPLAAAFTVVDKDGTVLVTGSAGTSGAFRIAFPPGAELVTVAAVDHAFFVICALEMEDGGPIALDRAVRVEGRVVDRRRNPIAGATVWAEDRARGWYPSAMSRIARTDSNGNFTIIDAPPGDVGVSARHPRFVEGRIAVDRARGGAVLQEVVLPLEERTSLRGRVVSPDGKPVAGAEVAFFLPSEVNSTHPEALDFTRTDSAGRFQLLGASEGWIAAHGKGLAYGSSVARNGAEIRLHDLPAVKGRVLGVQQKPVAGAIVARMTSYSVSLDGAAAESALLAFLGDGLEQVTTGKDGRFALPLFNHPDPEITLLAELPGRASAVKEVPRDRDAEIVLEPSFDVRGIVTSAGRRIRTEATVSAVQASDDRTTTRNVSVDAGTFDLLGLSPGLWTLVAVAEGRLDGPTVALKIGDAPPPRVVIELGPVDTRTKKTWHVMGRVLTSEGEPRAGARVRIESNRPGPRILPAKTGSDGRFAMDVPEGTPRLCAEVWISERSAGGKCTDLPAPDSSGRIDVGDLRLPRSH